MRKIDIDRWGSPVARQYDIKRLPELRLYEGTKLVSNDTAEVMQRLSQH